MKPNFSVSPGEARAFPSLLPQSDRYDIFPFLLIGQAAADTLGVALNVLNFRMAEDQAQSDLSGV